MIPEKENINIQTEEFQPWNDAIKKTRDQKLTSTLVSTFKTQMLRFLSF